MLQYNDLITFCKGTIQIYECSCEFNHRFLDLDAIVHYIVFFFRLRYLNTNLSLQKVWVTYLCGFNHVDIIQLNKKHIIQNNAFYIYTLTCPKLRLLWNSSVLVRSFGKFLEIVEGFNLVLVALGKGSCRV